jgi:5,6-dimethylbenzimidazole synthase
MSGPVFDDGFRARLDQLFHWRRDVRRFRTDPLPDGLLDRLLALANGAPSVGLSQPWRFVIVEAPARRAAVRANFQAANAAALAAQDDERAGLYARLKLAGLDEAPVHLAVCVDPDPAQGGGLGRATQPEMTAYSAVLAVHTLWLGARAEGLGVGWVSILEPGEVLRALDVPACWRLVAYLCIGWPSEEAEVPELEREGWASRQGPAVLRR